MGGEKEEGETAKLKDFNTNNLQGVFCKQNGGHHARSTCLSTLTLIVWGRRTKKKPKTLSSSRAGELDLHCGGCCVPRERDPGCCSTAQPVGRQPHTHSAFPLPLHSRVKNEDLQTFYRSWGFKPLSVLYRSCFLLLFSLHVPCVIPCWALPGS